VSIHEQHRFRLNDNIGRADLARLDELKCWPLKDSDYAKARKLIACREDIPTTDRLDLLRMLGLVP